MTKIELKIEYDAFKERTAGDMALQSDLLSCFEIECADVCKSLNDNILKKDNNAILSDLHKLKGSVGVFGFANITDRISELENALKSNCGIDFAIDLPELFSSIKKHIVELKKYIVNN
ncbi:MAG: Hpt domain-containing protein [Bacteroidales bacterium]|nr:Hpt domain-containing protein [Bacteroidales bacterium]